MTGDALPPEESTPALRSETGGLNMAEAVARTGRNSFKQKSIGIPCNRGEDKKGRDACVLRCHEMDGKGRDRSIIR